MNLLTLMRNNYDCSSYCSKHHSSLNYIRLMSATIQDKDDYLGISKDEMVILRDNCKRIYESIGEALNE